MTVIFIERARQTSTHVRQLSSRVSLLSGSNDEHRFEAAAALGLNLGF